LKNKNLYLSSIPNHVAIIMDGNGRWAQSLKRPRLYGHQAGVKAVRRIVKSSSELGIKCLTLYSFSTENWARPKAEIAGLFNLLRKYVSDDLEILNKNGVCIRILGSKRGLNSEMLKLVERVESTTKTNKSFQLNIAFNYGGRDEIIRAVAKALDAGESFDTMNEEALSPYLDTAGLPEPDLVIRTGEEKRLSNFLTWQTVYSEFVFTDVLWPDFNQLHLSEAVLEYQNRQRRFGSLVDFDVA
jgi:undecaprenyl diphosphate synthase